ncbi:MAG: glycosyltransferase [Patescibacteria group bacterium]|nr:glycosyltransferase [Patescibacteria group bacterium]
MSEGLSVVIPTYNKKKRIHRKKVCIIIPTYNEKENITKLIDALLDVFKDIKNFEMSILVVDDNSPDGTGKIVKKYSISPPHCQIHLLSGKKEGLGKAYIRGFNYAIKKLKADFVFEMDADFSHNPSDIPRFLEAVENGYDFVIGSRYVEGGSIPNNWGIVRKLNSKVGNIFARFIAGLYPIKDCTAGYRCISAKIIKKIDLENLNATGYSFSMNFLYEAIRIKAKVKEIPVDFIDRKFGESKIGFSDIKEFIINSFILRLKKSQKILLLIITSIFLECLLFSIGTIGLEQINFSKLLIDFYIAISLLMSVQCLMNLYMTLYIWETPERMERNKSPKKFLKPKKSFSILLPARNEEQVIGNTIQGLYNINYPKNLMEIIVICEKTDTGTIHQIRQKMNQINDDIIKLVIFDDKPINKPHGLNKGLAIAKNEVITIYDAEDEVNPDIFNVINTVMAQNKNVGIIQSGVQLMNYSSKWFSSHNVLEYYFWFKSRLHFHADVGMVPLGGNSVFFKHKILKEINGWDENCLTEDADIGIRLSTKGIKTMVIYDDLYATREEAPDTIKSFIKQRTRWVQGFLQVFLKFDWLQYPKLSQKLLAVYILLIPFLQAIMILMLPVSLFMMFKFKLPILSTIILILPVYLLFIQLTISLIGLYEFIKIYKLRFNYLTFLVFVITFFPYQWMLGISALRGLLRQIVGKNNWEKTKHLGAHRNIYSSEKTILEKTYETAN